MDKGYREGLAIAGAQLRARSLCDELKMLLDGVPEARTAVKAYIRNTLGLGAGRATNNGKLIADLNGARAAREGADTEKEKKKGHTMSPAARKKLALAMKKRWAAARKAGVNLNDSKRKKAAKKKQTTPVKADAPSAAAA